eukprot:g4048.t1
MPSAHALHVYRNLILLAKRLPDSKRADALAQIRCAFREHRGAAGEAAGALVRKAEETVSYLKIVTPKSKFEGSGKRAGADAGTKQYVYTKDGVLEGAAAATAKIPLSDRDYSDAVQRHTRSVRRQHFMDRGVAAPNGPFG